MVVLAGLVGGLLAYDAAVLDPKGLGSSLEGFLLVVSYWVAPWIAIVLVDRLMRKGQNFADIAQSKRENLAGPIAFVVSTVTSIYFFSNQYPTYVAPGAIAGAFADNAYDIKGDGGKLIHIITGGDITALVGFVIAAVLYFVLAKALKTTKK
jgi:NCS1 family nucleobase:cation symporter-1